MPGKEKYTGKIETGKVCEQPILAQEVSGRQHTSRDIRTSLNKKTRDEDRDIFIISNLSTPAADAETIAQQKN